VGKEDGRIEEEIIKTFKEEWLTRNRFSFIGTPSYLDSNIKT
jgi:hypothetical protein